MGGEPIADGLFTWPSQEPRLIGGSCPTCGARTFPLRDGCSRCGASGLERRELGDRGVLWTWTTQGFAPKEPFNGNVGVGEDAVPWFVGLVEIPGELRVEALLVGVREETLEIGMPMRLVIVPWRIDEEGHETVTFAFTPDVADRQDSTAEEAVSHA